MTNNDREALQRAVGIIEGVAYFTVEKACDALSEAIELIESVLEEGGEKK